MTFLFWREDAEDADDGEAAAKAPETVPAAVVITTDAGTVTQPVSGRLVNAKEIPDPMFSAETMGPSVGIQPDGETVYAPFDGTVTMLFPTKHASIPLEQRLANGIVPQLIRLSVGIEDAKDLIADLNQSLKN